MCLHLERLSQEGILEIEFLGHRVFIVSTLVGNAELFFKEN